MAKTARIEFRTDEAFIKALEDLAEKTNRSRAEVIRDAMNLYIRAVDEWDKGRGVTFVPMKEAQPNTNMKPITVSAKAPELSPAAQAVLDAYRNPHILKNTYAIAAALRAAADQVVPETQARTDRAAQRCLIRRQFHAIAAELENK